MGTLDQLRRHKCRLVRTVIHEGVDRLSVARLFPNDLTVFIENIDELLDDDFFVVLWYLCFRL
jgi:hypothetical protein